MKIYFFVVMIGCFCLTANAVELGEQRLVAIARQFLTKQLPIGTDIFQKMDSLASVNEQNNFYVPKQKIHHALFKKYPSLYKKIPYVSLAALPTPVEKLSELEKELGFKHLYIKRDDQTGLLLPDGKRLFGGNKMRKLEFLFGEAFLNGAQSIITFGCAGSNHVVATAACAQYLGFPCVAFIKPQPNARIVQRNLLLMKQYGADIHYCIDNQVRALGAVYQFFKTKSETGVFPYLIPTGGSTAIGALGYVNAAFELQEQIHQGLLPCPDYLYVAAGSCGTIAGLIVGCKAAGLPTRVVGVAIEPEDRPGELQENIRALCSDIIAFLSGVGDEFPRITMQEEDVRVLYGFEGQAYGLFTHEGVQAMQNVADHEQIALEGTYTGKAFAGMLADIKNVSKNSTILFWNTFCAQEEMCHKRSPQYLTLPHALHEYFRNPVQELDR